MSAWRNRDKYKSVPVTALYFSQLFFGQFISLLFTAKGKFSVQLSEKNFTPLSPTFTVGEHK